MLSFDQNKLLIASHNEGKISEFRELLSFSELSIVSSKELGLIEPIEDGNTFEANALIKAKSGCELSGLTTLSDDSGLAVDALGGDPGIYSARWAGPNKDFDYAMKEVNRLLDEKKIAEENRSARFICALCLYKPNGDYSFFVGEVDGKIVWPPRGEHGFGYDAIFKPNDGLDTFGELTSIEKHSWSREKIGLSHRARAFDKFVKFLINSEN